MVGITRRSSVTKLTLIRNQEAGLGKEETNSWKGGDPDRGWRSEEWISGWSEEQGKECALGNWDLDGWR